jgi:hypothetical protein
MEFWAQRTGAPDLVFERLAARQFDRYVHPRAKGTHSQGLPAHLQTVNFDLMMVRHSLRV